jgi:hypothetical protein
MSPIPNGVINWLLFGLAIVTILLILLYSGVLR